MMKKILFSLALAWSCLIPLKAFTYPMLSDDGSLLTGVLVNGQLYDVTFGDAVLGDIFSSPPVGTQAWWDLANAVKQGIVEALNALPVLPLPADIMGCTGAPPIAPFDPAPNCVILIPDQISFINGADNTGFGDHLGVLVSAAGTGAFRSIVSSGFWVPAAFDTSPWGQLTFAQFQPAAVEVPAPGSLYLMALALLAMGWRRLHAGLSLPG
jgi:hypothetical protein